MVSRKLSEIYKKNTPARFFRYLLLYLKPDTINMIISSISDFHLSRFTLYNL